MGEQESIPGNGWAIEQGVARGGEDVYPYEDEQGHLLFQIVRRAGKQFLARRRSPNGDWVWDLEGVGRVIYRLPEVVLAEKVYLVEGERDVETLRKLDLVATTNPGGVNGWKQEYARFLRGKHINLIPDEDGPGDAWADRVMGDLRGVAASVKRIRLPGLPLGSGADITDWLATGHSKNDLLRLVEETPFVDGDDIRSSIIEELELFFLRYLCLEPGVSLLLALWTLGTHLFPGPGQSEDYVFDQYPYLHVTSPTKRAGKSRLGEIVDLVSARAQLTAGVTEGALFRMVQQERPTLIFDEAEPLNRRRSERAGYLLSILNVGHRRGAKVVRCAKRSADGGFELERYGVYCPKVIITIGDIPATLADRAICISMKRRTPDQELDTFLYRYVGPMAAGLRQQMECWAEKNREAVRAGYAAEPVSFLEDREAESWSPLFALCRVACVENLPRLENLAKRLSAGKEADDQDFGIQLLADIEAVFAEVKTDFISTTDLLSKLQAIEDSPWGEPGRELTSHRLGKMLRPYKIKSERQGRRSDRMRGYSRASFEDAFSRYLPHRQDDHSGHRQRNQQHARETETGHADAEATSILADNPLETTGVANVAGLQAHAPKAPAAGRDELAETSNEDLLKTPGEPGGG